MNLTDALIWNQHLSNYHLNQHLTPCKLISSVSLWHLNLKIPRLEESVLDSWWGSHGMADFFPEGRNPKKQKIWKRNTKQFNQTSASYYLVHMFCEKMVAKLPKLRRKSSWLKHHTEPSRAMLILEAFGRMGPVDPSSLGSPRLEFGPANRVALETVGISTWNAYRMYHIRKHSIYIYLYTCTIKTNQIYR